MIEVKNLVKYYGNTKVLKKVNFEVKRNELFGLLGPNGAGKTTTLECMEGLRGFNEGEIIIQGMKPEKALKKGIIGVQLQSSSLPYNINVKDAMTLFCKWNNIPIRYDLLDSFGLKDMYNKKYKTMSTGQKRRLHLCLALSNNPEILFLDEPTAGLDVEGRVALHKEIKKLKESGVTIILASHDMAEVESLCDRVGILVNGEIKKIGSPEEIVLEVKKESVIKVKIDKDLDVSYFKKLVSQPKNNGYYRFTTDNVLEGLSELIDYVKLNKFDLLDLSIDKPTLEERFMEIAKEGK